MPHRRNISAPARAVSAATIRRARILLAAGAVFGAPAAWGQNLAAVPGVVVSHQPAGAPVYISSPSITIMPNGDYFASHDLFGSGTAQNTTKVFRSTDKGQSWTQTATVVNQFWSTIFNYNGALYIWGYRNGSDTGDIQIRKSTNNGVTWTTPTNGTNGLLVDGDFGGTANSPVIHNGRLWIAQGGKRIMSAAVASDLMLASSWTLSDAANTNSTPLGSGLTITEAQVVASPQTGVVILPKIGELPNTVLIRASANPAVVVQPTAADYVSLPGGEKKFGAAYDAVSGKFYALDNPVLSAHAGITTPALTRTAAAMLSSRDLVHWDVEKVFLFTPNIDNGSWGEAFQYLNFAIDGEDLAVISRTAFDVGGTKPPRGHDSNLMTFHRIEDFRTATPSHMLVADTNNNRVMRYELTQTNSLAPIGTFNLGSTFAGAALNKPLGLAQSPDGDVFVGEEVDGGRILRFDAFGNFKQVVATEGVHFSGRPEALVLGADGSLYMSTAFGTDSDRVYKINPQTGAVSTLVDTNFAGGSLNNPRGLAIGPDGNLYVADRESNVIRKFNPASGAFLGNINIGGRPQAMVWSDELNQFLAATRVGAQTDLHSIAPDGSSTPIYDVAGIGASLGIEVIDGQIFWSDFDNGRIYKHTGDDQKFNSVVTGLSGPGHLLSVDQPAEGERSWIATSAGNWADPVNWYYWGRPDTSYEVANFGSAIGGAGTIALDNAYTMKGLRFRSEHAYRIAGTGSITIESDNGVGVIESLAGQHVIAVPVKLNHDLSLRVDNSASLRFEQPVNAASKAITKVGGGTAQFPNVRAASLDIVEGTVRITSTSRPNDAAGTSVVKNLSIHTAGALDLGNSALVVDYSGPSPVLDVRDLLRSGRDTGDRGLFTGSSFGVYALGYADNASLNRTTFAGQSVDATSVLVLFTRPGDANLDLSVDIGDFSSLAAGFNQPGVWTNGDFDYDGVVGIGDFALLASNFSRGVPAELPRVAIPEPASASAVFAAAGTISWRRKRMC